MSDSRLEKFIYAICSMDVSDLPVPLSRIEKLWNCLITGETPDFEPLSRNEKYLMAMLDRYDISNLPAPMSRGEKLLYKIAVGETDLSDVPGYLSRYEELLKYLIENGGISGGDFEYVLYTLNQSLYTLYTTAEKPVKSAILTGNSIKNYKNNLFDNVLEKGMIDFSTGEPSQLNLRCYRSVNFIPINGNFKIAKYGIYGDLHVCFYDSNKSFISMQTYVLRKVLEGNTTITPPTNSRFIKFYNPYDDNEPTGGFGFGVMAENEIIELEIQSVKMPVLTTTGKNLFNGNIIGNYYVNINGDLVAHSECYATDFIEIKPNTNFSTNTRDNEITAFYDEDKKFISWVQSKTFLSPSNARFLRTTIKPLSLLDTFQLEEGTTTTPYEPYKSNILTVNEPIELRGIGDIQDELNLSTGELIQRVSEFIIDENTSVNKYQDIEGFNTAGYYINIPSNFVLDKTDFICNSLPKSEISKIQPGLTPVDKEGITINVGYVKFRVSNEKGANVEDFKKYLEINPIKLIIPLVEKSVKTVDLTIVDQDNQPTELGTFENVTHVSLEAENLIPKVEMEVATRISTELASASPLMDDISNDQQQLEVTVDEQSDNVDATMIAVTEIYEETL